MKVKEAREILASMPDELEIMDEYGENILTQLRVSEYNDPDGDHDYVAYETMGAD